MDANGTRWTVLLFIGLLSAIVIRLIEHAWLLIPALIALPIIVVWAFVAYRREPKA